MTIARIVGTSFGNGIEQAKNSYSEAKDGTVTVERTFRAFEQGWLAICPPRGSAHPDYPEASLIQRTAKQSSIPMLVDVTLTYESPRPADLAPDDPNNPNNNQGGGGGGSSSYLQLPPDEYSETANSVEVPIEAHPDFSTFGTVENGAIFNDQGKFTGWKKDSPYVGYLTYKVGSVTETVTKYYRGQPPSVSSLIGTADGGHWLTVSGSVQRRSPFWTQSITRIYSTLPWNSVIYP